MSRELESKKTSIECRVSMLHDGLKIFIDKNIRALSLVMLPDSSPEEGSHFFFRTNMCLQDFYQAVMHLNEILEKELALHAEGDIEERVGE